MKYLYLFFIAIALCSCSKDEQSADTLRQEMAAKWTYGYIFKYNYTAQGILKDSTRIGTSKNDFFEFKNDGSFNSSSANGTSIATGTFNTSAPTKFSVRQVGINYACKVISLNFERFIFTVQEPKVAGQPYSQTTHTVYR